MRSFLRRFFFALALCIAGASIVPATTQTLPTLKVGATANDTFAEAYYAQDMGFFKKAGLNVELSTFTNGASVANAVASGAIDIGISNPVGLAGAVTHGIPFTIVAGGGLYSTKEPTTVLCIAANSAIRTAKDLEGKTIAVSALKDLTQLGALAWLAKGGADVSKITSVELPFAEMGPALERGTVAAAVISEPSLSSAKNRGLVRVFGKAFDAIAPQFLIGAWFSTADFTQKNPDLVKRFVSAIYETGRWANAHQSESGAILAKYSKLPPEAVAAMARSTYAVSLTPTTLQPLLDIAFKNSVITRSVSASELIAR
jgi:NitT/TauT family transport system substrate-binding protein